MAADFPQSVKNEARRQLDAMRRGAVQIYTEEELLAKIATAIHQKWSLRIKLGMDPTAPPEGGPPGPATDAAAVHRAAPDSSRAAAVVRWSGKRFACCFHSAAVASMARAVAPSR